MQKVYRVQQLQDQQRQRAVGQRLGRAAYLAGSGDGREDLELAQGEA